MNQEENNVEINESFPRRHRRSEEDPKEKYRALRQALNIIFMLGALIGVLVYFSHHETLGIYIILGSMAFKFVECVLRLMK